MILAAFLLLGAASHLVPLNQSKLREVVRSHRGKVLLIDFWATWCEPCREELPKLAAMQSRMRSKDFVVVTVSADEPEQESEAAAFLSRIRMAAPAYIKRVENDQKFIDGIDPKWSGALPALFLFDRRGRKVKSFIGETDLAEVESAIRRLSSSRFP